MGACTVTAHQAGGNVIWTDADPVSRTFDVLPAPLEITADDASKTYGDPDPELTASFDGLVNGDTKADITGLVLTGPPADSGAGSYDIVASNAANPHYDISYVAGTMTVGKAPLTVTPADRTRVYGADKPPYTAGFDGLVNGDTGDDITGLQIDGPAKAAGVGSYDIVASAADNPNYAYTYETGTETITAAPLTITADDTTVTYGAAVTPTWTGVGWVNGDTDEGIRTPPTCTAAGTAPGQHLGAVGCAGAEDPNYTIGYAAGTLTVNPVIRLDQTGLPAGMPRRPRSTTSPSPCRPATWRLTSAPATPSPSPAWSSAQGAGPTSPGLQHSPDPSPATSSSRPATGRWPTCCRPRQLSAASTGRQGSPCASPGRRSGSASRRAKPFGPVTPSSGSPTRCADSPAADREALRQDAARLRPARLRVRRREGFAATSDGGRSRAGRRTASAAREPERRTSPGVAGRAGTAGRRHERAQLGRLDPVQR